METIEHLLYQYTVLHNKNQVSKINCQHGDLVLELVVSFFQSLTNFRHLKCLERMLLQFSLKVLVGM